MLPLPATHLPSSVVELIAAHASKTEAIKEITPEILELIYEQQWLRVLIPASIGGLEWPLPKVVQLFEDLARAEANTGWCVNLGAGANMFAGYIEKDSAQQLFSPQRTWCAGSGAVSGIATKTSGGYLLTGSWKYASGANHATYFTANATLKQENGTAIYENESPAFRSFIFPAASVTNHRNWDAIGLTATSSNDFSVEELFVPEHAVFSLSKPSPHASGPLYRFPFPQLAVVNMACMVTGISLHFASLYEDLAAQKQPLHSQQLLVHNETAQRIFRDYLQSFLEARQQMWDSLQECWLHYEQGSSASEAALNILSQQARGAAQKGLEFVRQLFPLCGMNILAPGTELNKVWRDAMTAGQHYLLSPLLETA